VNQFLIEVYSDLGWILTQNLYHKNKDKETDDNTTIDLHWKNDIKEMKIFLTKVCLDLPLQIIDQPAGMYNQMIGIQLISAVIGQLLLKIFRVY
jgi:hypothetical protein